MKAIVITTGGGPEVLQLQQVEDPELKDDEVLIKVEATALNRADTLQRKGSYPPPKGASPYPGLECSGTIQAVGKNVLGWIVGDQVCALLSGGGYAEKVAVPAGQVLPIPLGVSLKEAAGLPEVACTVWSTVFMMSRLSAGETFLVHGGSSGIGTFAIQIAKSKGATVFVTAGLPRLGADLCINYKTEDFVAHVKEETGGKGVDVILDCIGPAYLQRNLDSLNFDGRLCIIGLQGGAVTEIKLNTLFPKRLTVQGAALRPRNPENKAMVVNEVEKNVWPEIVAGKVKPIIYKSFPLSEAVEAHKLMEMMKAVVITSPGDPEVQLQEVEEPEIKDDEVLIKTEAAALNRGDIYQRQGFYPPPEGASTFPGLECSGIIEAVGENVSRWKVGDKVCALLSGGGYAEKVAVPAGQVLPVPSGVSLSDAASLPEVACTVWSTVFTTSRLCPGETLLIHGGSSGIGTFAIQIAKFKGAKVFVTVGDERKLAFCNDLGADLCINYKTEDFVVRVKEETEGKGVDVILDCVGAAYLQRNLDCLNVDGRLFIIGSISGFVAELNIAAMFAKRLSIQAAALRTRSVEEKASIVKEVENNVWPAIMSGKVKPVVHQRFPLREAAEAHRLMESGNHIGKILLIA
ncbi:hypothetical protein ES332_A05G178700v1 [Gossypium tomentosum]|uniref:Enoyl reductase (ER) domain-containing protein n=1 Tax=Gossypium tomentosum TaxID=34277 RepID=A0A5D2QJF7_GOSTO|nr:hypothetical protein ES332_A05G178700v1 [Gossypium tomentosum]